MIMLEMVIPVAAQKVIAALNERLAA